MDIIIKDQEFITEQFNNFTLDTLPHTILLVGKFGCGKHFLVNQLCSKLSLGLEQIDDTLNLELLNKINELNIPTVCLFNGSAITIKEESVLLKFIEEPKSNIFNIILCESAVNMLDTIINRCTVYRFKDYTINYLKSILEDDYQDFIYTIADTPGKLKTWNINSIPAVKDFCNKILQAIPKLSLTNILTAVDKIDFKHEDNSKYNFELFITVLLYCAKENVILNIPNAFNVYKLTNSFYNNIYITNLNKVYLFENYLYNLKQLVWN